MRSLSAWRGRLLSSLTLLNSVFYETDRIGGTDSLVLVRHISQDNKHSYLAIIKEWTGNDNEDLAVTVVLFNESEVPFVWFEMTAELCPECLGKILFAEKHPSSNRHQSGGLFGQEKKDSWSHKTLFSSWENRTVLWRCWILWVLGKVMSRRDGEFNATPKLSHATMIRMGKYFLVKLVFARIRILHW